MLPPSTKCVLLGTELKHGFWGNTQLRLQPEERSSGWAMVLLALLKQSSQQHKQCTEHPLNIKVRNKKAT